MSKAAANHAGRLASWELGLGPAACITPGEKLERSRRSNTHGHAHHNVYSREPGAQGGRETAEC